MQNAKDGLGSVQHYRHGKTKIKLKFELANNVTTKLQRVSLSQSQFKFGFKGTNNRNNRIQSGI